MISFLPSKEEYDFICLTTYKALVGYLGLEDAGIITAVGEENESEAKLMEIRVLAKAL